MSRKLLMEQRSSGRKGCLIEDWGGKTERWVLALALTSSQYLFLEPYFHPFNIRKIRDSTELRQLIGTQWSPCLILPLKYHLIHCVLPWFTPEYRVHTCYMYCLISLCVQFLVMQDVAQPLTQTKKYES